MAHESFIDRKCGKLRFRHGVREIPDRLTAIIGGTVSPVIESLVP